MSYAVESKKRKFHRMLESISKPLTLETASRNPGPESTMTTKNRTPADLSIKRVRLDNNDTSEYPAVRKSTSKIARPDLQRTSSSVSTSSTRPTFVPWDRERFLERLETFRRVDRWTSKPAAINEVQWAKCGWVCTDVARVSCISNCGGSVVVKLPDEIDEVDGFDMEKVQERKQVRLRLVEEYQKQMIEEHGENCPWRNRGCDATIQHLPLTNVDVAILGLRTRYTHLIQMSERLPTLETLRFPDSFDIESLVHLLPADWSPKSDRGTLPPSDSNEEAGGEAAAPPPTDLPSQDVNKAALAIALFGWDSTPDSSTDLVACKACFRRLGLWMYKPKANGDRSVFDSLDVAAEHMEYCPWTDRNAQSGTGKVNQNLASLRSGWEIVAEAIKVKHRRQERSTAPEGSPRPEQKTHDAEVSGDEGAPDEEKKKAADREWWAKIRRMRQVWTHKTPRRKPAPPASDMP
ncbi:Uncharacterized protein PECH_004172 [Penicillium ucsense]|uniref:C3HC-type domain-containing protein n=1 Tax=Penicillium ucsense TaxID=2839758 RepID=A0A8J8W9N2_9EURO|nr:Uncharacterized protein PECM_005579 [Penicillium ucsense]KAF7737254.1 Uncharacterized protein PECH_004172 [Penicillium ucsense]